MVKFPCLLFSLALVGTCGAKSTPPPAPASPPGAKVLHGERVRMELSHDADHNATLHIIFTGGEPEIKYGVVEVRAFDKKGMEIPVAHWGESATYDNIGFGGHRSDSQIGYYKPAGPEESVAKVTIAWKGETIVFAPPTKARYITYKPIHGGRAGVTAQGWPDGRTLLNVLFQGNVPEIKYGDLTLTAFDQDGRRVPVTRFSDEGENYIVDSQNTVFTGLYTTPPGVKSISKVIIAWDGEKTEFPVVDLRSP